MPAYLLVPAELTLRTICNALGEIKHKWLEVGIQLGISRSKLMEFKREEDPLSAAIEYWLKGNVENVPISWATVIKALESSHVGEGGLAAAVRKKACLCEVSEAILNPEG